MIFTEVEHDIVITVVRCETCVVIVSAQLETVMIERIVHMRWDRYMCKFYLRSG